MKIDLKKQMRMKFSNMEKVIKIVTQREGLKEGRYVIYMVDPRGVS